MKKHLLIIAFTLLASISFAQLKPKIIKNVNIEPLPENVVFQTESAGKLIVVFYKRGPLVEVPPKKGYAKQWVYSSTEFFRQEFDAKSRKALAKETLLTKTDPEFRTISFHELKLNLLVSIKPNVDTKRTEYVFYKYDADFKLIERMDFKPDFDNESIKCSSFCLDKTGVLFTLISEKDAGKSGISKYQVAKIEGGTVTKSISFDAQFNEYKVYGLGYLKPTVDGNLLLVQDLHYLKEPNQMYSKTTCGLTMKKLDINLKVISTNTFTFSEKIRKLYDASPNLKNAEIMNLKECSTEFDNDGNLYAIYRHYYNNVDPSSRSSSSGSTYIYIFCFDSNLKLKWEQKIPKNQAALNTNLNGSANLSDVKNLWFFYLDCEENLSVAENKTPVQTKIGRGSPIICAKVDKATGAMERFVLDENKSEDLIYLNDADEVEGKLFYDVEAKNKTKSVNCIVIE